MSTGPASTPSSLSRLALWCPGCGAKSSFEPGKLPESCHRCRSTLRPPREAAGGAMEGSRERWLAAQQRRIRAERRTMLWVQSYSYLVGARGCLLAFAAAGFAALGLLALFDMFRLDGRLVTVAAITAVATVLSFRTLASFRRCRGARWPDLEALVSLHRGQRVVRFRDVLAWFNIRWLSYYPPLFLADSSSTNYAAMTCGEVKVMLNVNLEAQGLLDTSRLHLLLATPLDVRDEAHDEVELSGDAARARARLENLGFAAEVRAAGVWIQARRETLTRYRSDGIPRSRLQEVLDHGLELAGAMKK